MRWPKMRPRFIVEVSCSAQDVMDALRARLPGNDRGIEGQLSERHGVLTVAAGEQHFWSTQLGLTVEDARIAPGGRVTDARVLGIFSPHPEIWTAFVFAIGTLIALGVFGTMWAIVQLSLGQLPWALLAPLLAVLLAALVYTSTLVGQGLAADEMYLLRAHLDECLAEAEGRAAREPRTALDSARL